MLLMKKNILKRRKEFTLSCKIDRIHYLAEEFDREEEPVKLHRLTSDLFDRLTEQLSGSGKMQLVQFTDALNKLMCMQATYFYTNGLEDGSTLTCMMPDERLSVTLNITVV